MNIGDMWDPANYDDPDLTEEELKEVIEIHKRHKDDETVITRSPERDFNIQS